MSFKAKNLKGASPLHLNNKELRRELYRADVIILTALSLMHAHQQQTLKYQLERCHTTEASDPLAEETRMQAMHRITAKCEFDYIKLFLFTATLILSALHIANYYS